MIEKRRKHISLHKTMTLHLLCSYIYTGILSISNVLVFSCYYKWPAQYFQAVELLLKLMLWILITGGPQSNFVQTVHFFCGKHYPFFHDCLNFVSFRSNSLTLDHYYMLVISFAANPSFLPRREKGRWNRWCWSCTLEDYNGRIIWLIPWW